ncbi:uncharacterized protein LOC106013132 [Aplysia californica]|uniref:Uncharacterized protein LOC106013132 n=1 Tax=Aplysia californica TaxID=6500 RepID=A0ABM1A9Q7_APLCA|nr:uncharacterized protein LOC106013132 [Aplysia californica]
MRVYFVLAAVLSVLTTWPAGAEASNMWTDILSCVHRLTNETAPDGNVTDDLRPAQEFSMIKLFSVICSEREEFVHCLDTSLKQSSDSMAQMIGSLFDANMVSEAYEGLCKNITAIEESGNDVLGCLSEVKLTSCQGEMADYFFYMGVVKKFAPPSEQLSQNTMETLLCSATAQRRQCEVQALRACSPALGDVMGQFYTQTKPDACVRRERQEALKAAAAGDAKVKDAE